MASSMACAAAATWTPGFPGLFVIGPLGGVLIEAWRNHYNEVRPHSSLQYLTPAEFKLELRKELQPAVF